MKNELISHLSTLIDFQEYLFDQGHDFWHCDAVDKENKMPFYYYQRNKNVNMSTCGTCQKLMELRRKIRKVQKQLGIEQTPFVTSFKREEHVKNVCVKNHSSFNPTAAYAN